MPAINKAMPALSLLISGDADPWAKELARVESLSTSAGKAIQAQYASTALYLQGQISLAKRAGTSFAAYEAELAIVQGQLGKMVAGQAALAVATTAATGATIAEGNAFSKIFSAANWKMAANEMLVVTREIARGNWSRVPASISILTQRLGILGAILSPIGLAVIAAGGAFYLWHKHITAVNAGLQKTEEMLSTGFGDVLKANTDAMREAAQAASDFNSWLARLGVTHETLADKSSEAVAAMEEEFQLLRQLGTARGETEGQKSGAEQNLRKRELEEVSRSLLEQRRIAEQSKSASVAAKESATTGDDATHREKIIAELPGKITSADESIKRLETLRSELSDTVEKSIATDTHRTERKFIRGGITIPPELSPAQLREEKELELFQTKAGPMTSLAAVTEQLQNTKKYRTTLDSETIRLAAVQRDLADAMREAKDTAQRDSQAVERLTKERDKLSASVALHAKYDPQIATAKDSRAAARGQPGLTLWERAGGIIGISRPVDPERVTRQILKETQQTNAHLKAIIGASKSAAAGRF